METAAPILPPVAAPVIALFKISPVNFAEFLGCEILEETFKGPVDAPGFVEYEFALWSVNFGLSIRNTVTRAVNNPWEGIFPVTGFHW